MFSFKWPLVIYLLPISLFIFYFVKYNNQKSNKKNIIKMPINNRLKKSFSNVGLVHHKKNNIFFNIMFFVIWTLLILALMRPQMVDEFKNTEQEGFDIVLGVDLSGSMIGLDFSTKTQEITRLDATKIAVNKFVQRREHDRIGLIVFASKAYSYVPLSYDKSVVSKMLDTLQIGMAGEYTAIGDAIGLATKSMRNKKLGSKIFILLTDGEDNSSSIPPVEAAKIAKKYGIKIYTIGIGNKGLIPHRDQFGRIQYVQMPLDEKLLQEIAEITGGNYKKAENLDVLSQIYLDIDNVEKHKVASNSIMISRELYRYPLVIALLIFLLISLMNGHVRVGKREFN